MVVMKMPMIASASLALLCFSSLNAIPALAQPSPYQQRIAQLRVMSAFYQQQAAVQTATQQTSLLLQAAVRQDTAFEPSGFFRPLDFQQQESAIRTALQQTTVLQQVSLQSGSGVGQTSLGQIDALRSALRTTLSLKAALQIQNGQLTPDQIQSLFGEQTSLTTLLASPPPQISTAVRSK
jgi:hypothetical protein